MGVNEDPPIIPKIIALIPTSNMRIFVLKNPQKFGSPSPQIFPKESRNPFLVFALSPNFGDGDIFEFQAPLGHPSYNEYQWHSEIEIQTMKFLLSPLLAVMYIHIFQFSFFFGVQNTLIYLGALYKALERRDNCYFLMENASKKSRKSKIQ